MPKYVFCDESPRLYPYPPIVRTLFPGDEVDLEEDQVPGDGRFVPADQCPHLDRLLALAAWHREDAAAAEAAKSAPAETPAEQDSAAAAGTPSAGGATPAQDATPAASGGQGAPAEDPPPAAAAKAKPAPKTAKEQTA